MPHRNREAYNAYMRDYMRERYAKRRAEALLLLGGKCVDCGSAADLEIDHADHTTKSFEIGKRLATGSWERLLPELMKCVVRCRACHATKTTHDKGSVPARGTHGTLSSYRYCRCDVCKQAKSDHARKKYLERKAARAAGVLVQGVGPSSPR